ncbi:MAG: ABC transporter permease subunit [Gammaproteobacteria bacterium]|nr:ABC transporter permease subunit [Gammaproteobacteria bacterium]MCP5199573.1 ABC transporter permease subunit [Gammaproteobacteria bacterium]
MTRATPRGRLLVLALPYAWLALFFLVPLLIVLKISFAQSLIAQPPYTPLVAHDADGLHLAVHLDAWRLLAGDALYAEAWLGSVAIAATTTAVCLLLGYPMAWAMARAPRRRQALLLMAVVLPFWTSFLLRVYAWMGLLGRHGPLNEALLALGLVERPLVLLHTPFAVYLGLVYAYLPFMVLPLYATLERLDEDLLEAAADLGARPGRAFLAVTLPLSLPGIVAGCVLVFVPALGELIIPDLLGGPDTLMIGKVLWDEFFANRAWPVAAALAVAMLALVGAVLVVQRALGARLAVR